MKSKKNFALKRTIQTICSKCKYYTCQEKAKWNVLHLFPQKFPNLNNLENSINEQLKKKIESTICKQNNCDKMISKHFISLTFPQCLIIEYPRISHRVENKDLYFGSNLNLEVDNFSTNYYLNSIIY